MTRWAYRSIKTTPEELPSYLDGLGADGWECFQLTWDGPWVYGWLKRPLPAGAPRGLHGRLAAAGYQGGER